MERQTIEGLWLAGLVERIRRSPSRLARLPGRERRVAELAIAGNDVHYVASQARVAEAAVWDLLERLAREVAGELPERPREIAGLGADLDPGVTGGYGETVDFEEPTARAEEGDKHDR